MHIHLRERYVEAFLGKGFVHFLVHAEKHSPVKEEIGKLFTPCKRLHEQESGKYVHRRR